MQEYWNWKNLGTKTGTTEARFPNRISEIEEEISDTEDTIKQLDTSLKENVKSTKLIHKTSTKCGTI